MVTGGDAEDEALLLWSLVVEDESITESILIVHPLFVNQKKKFHYPHYESPLQTDKHALQNHGHPSKPMLMYIQLDYCHCNTGQSPSGAGNQVLPLDRYVCLSVQLTD